MKMPQLPQLKPRERLLAAAGGVVLVIVLLDRAVLSPWARHARTVRGEIHQMEQALQSHQRLLSRRGRVWQEFQEYQRYLKPPIADDLQMANLLQEIQDLASQSHVEISEIKPLAVETIGAMKRYPLEVKFQCTMNEWVEFVYRIDTSASLYQILRAGLSTQEDRPDQLAGSLRVVSAAMQSGMSPITAQP